MKKILIDENVPQFKANLHCHSRYSDGANTVEELKEMYLSHGYSVIAFTDHEHIIDNSRLSDENFLALTGCELAVKRDARESTMINKRMKVVHLNLYAKDPHNVDTPCYSSEYDHFIYAASRGKVVHSCGEYKRTYSAEGVNEIIRTASGKGFLVSYNHPRWSLETAREYLCYDGLWGVEIYNHNVMQGGLFEYDVAVYDDMLRDGKRLACTACDDNHNGKNNDSFGGFTYICAEKLEYGAVISAMEGHRLYASTGPVIKSLTFEDGVATLVYDGGNCATATSAGRRSQRSEGCGVARFDVRPEDVYVRFGVTDGRGHHADTCAYFTDWLFGENK